MSGRHRISPKELEEELNNIYQTLLLIKDTDGIKKVTDTVNVDVIDRAARLLGIVYGDTGQLAQRATRDLYVQLRQAGVEIDPRDRNWTLSQATDSVQVTPIVASTWDVSDRWARQLGQADLARVLGAALTSANPVITGLFDAAGNRMPSMDAAARAGYVVVGAALPAGTNSIGTVVTTQNCTYDHAVFDASASGNIVVAVASKVIKVHAITIQAQGTVVVNINDGNGGASLAEWSFQAREGVVYSFAPYPAHWFQTSVNTALYATLSAAVVVTMNAVYSDDDAS